MSEGRVEDAEQVRVMYSPRRTEEFDLEDVMFSISVGSREHSPESH